MFCRELLTCWTQTGPGGLELLMPEVVLGTPTGDEYRATLDDGNVTGEKALQAVIVTRSASVLGAIAASCQPELVEIHTVLG